MAFQDRAESLASRLHLDGVPRPVFAGVALVLALLLAAAVCAFAVGGGEGAFEVQRAEADAAATEPSEEGGEARGDAGEEGPDAPVRSGEDVVLPSSESAAPAQVCVHVDGCVESPGVYYVPAGSRVIDAVAAAGGALAGARTETVNLAQEVQDGQQIIIPAAATDVGAADDAAEPMGSPAPEGQRVSINTATAEELQTLKGIGEATAEKIVADREANGPFASLEDLTRVSGIGEKKLAAIRDGICL